jgi:hypothetical protein
MDLGGQWDIKTKDILFINHSKPQITQMLTPPPSRHRPLYTTAGIENRDAGFYKRTQLHLTTRSIFWQESLALIRVDMPESHPYQFTQKRGQIQRSIAVELDDQRCAQLHTDAQTLADRMLNRGRRQTSDYLY